MPARGVERKAKFRESFTNPISNLEKVKKPLNLTCRKNDAKISDLPSRRGRG